LGEKKEKQEKKEKKGEPPKKGPKKRMYVAPSEVAAGFGFALARKYPKYAKREKLLGLFADHWVRVGARLGEYRGRRATGRGPYTLELSDGSAIEPERACLARYANFARAEADANAEFVERGGRAYLVATRAIAPHAEILTYMAHEPPARPGRNAAIAYKHLERAQEHAGYGDKDRRERHERETPTRRPVQRAVPEAPLLLRRHRRPAERSLRRRHPRRPRRG
jgi:hypothetical protein